MKNYDRIEMVGDVMIKQIINAKVVLPDGILDGGVVGFSDGIIDYIGTEAKKGIETVSAEGKYLFPGFIDIHCHGGNSFDFMDASPDRKYQNFTCPTVQQPLLLPR